MLPNTLVTNEIKNAAGTEVEFQRISQSARSTEFAVITEAPNLPNRLFISHEEIGTGVDLRRRSLISFRKSVAGVSGETRKTTLNLSIDIPVGDIANTDEPKAVLAYMMSFVASLGANTTILYDGSGNGAQTVLTGGL